MIDVFYIGSIVIAASNTNTVSKPAKFRNSSPWYVSGVVEYIVKVGI